MFQFTYEEKIYEYRQDGLFVLDSNLKLFKKVDNISYGLNEMLVLNKKKYELNKYKILRKKEYEKLNQFELLYDDKINNTNNWENAIKEIKERYPKNGID